tara:strand:- start:272 stop:547 length:276 start_codon:yes stop_codon:yes gene_type:complete
VQLLKHLDERGVKKVSYEQLDKLMSNMDAQEYSYETFDAAYNADPAISNIVDNYNGEEIVLQKEKQVNKKDNGTSNVKQMAKRATDLKDLN